MTTSREKYAADQARVLRERSGRTEHTVSVSPKRVSDPAGASVATFTWRGVCVCGWRSNRSRSTMLRAEQAAIQHRATPLSMPSTGSKRVTEPISEGVSHSEAPQAVDGAGS